MKINSLDIKGFGKLKNIKIIPKEGFNIIYEPNESGKSTLLAFIKAMLYGMKGGRKSRDGTLPPLRHYKPWSLCEQYAGVMEYTLDNGQRFRVGRNFEKGTANIHDAGANNLTAQFPQDKETGPKFSEEHLGLDEATFERSAFIRQLQSVIDEEGRKSLVEKLSNLNATGSEDLSLNRALSVLETALLERVGTGRSTTRPLDKVNLRLSELETKRRELLSLKERYLDTARLLHEKKAQFEILEEKLRQKKQLRAQLKGSRLIHIKKSLAGLENELDLVGLEIIKSRNALEELSAFKNADENQVQEALLHFGEAAACEEEISSLKNQISALSDKAEAVKALLDSEETFIKRTGLIEGRLKDYTPPKSSPMDEPGEGKVRKAPGGLAVPALGLLLSFVMLGLYLISSSPAFIAAGLIMAMASAMLLMLKAKNGKPHNEPSQAEDLIAAALAEANFSSLDEYFDYKEKQLKLKEQFEHLQAQLGDMRARLRSVEDKYAQKLSSVDRILTQAGLLSSMENRSERVLRLKHGVEELKKTQYSLNSLVSQKTLLEEKIRLMAREASNIFGKTIENAQEFDMAYEAYVQENGPVEDREASVGESVLEEEINMISTSLKAAELEIAGLNARLENAPADGDLNAIDEEILRLAERKESLTMAGASLQIAIDALKEVSLRLQRDYVPALNHEMSRMVSRLTSNRYEAVRTNDSLQVFLEAPDTDELVPVNRLSSGTIDQIYLGMRLASVRLIEKGKERLPLFLDEPFCQYDEERITKAFELLKAMSEDRQIFFFTCREREFELARLVFGESLNRIRL